MTTFQMIIAVIITVSIPVMPLIILMMPIIITEYIRYSDRNKLENEDDGKKHRIIKFVGSFETRDEYTLIGIWGFSKKQVIRKIKRLKQNGVVYDGVFAPLREVKHFPNHCEWLV